MAGALGLIRVKSAADLREEQAATVSFDVENEVFTDKLASFVQDAFTAAKDYRASSGIDSRLEYASKTRSGEYDPEKLRAIRAVGGSEEYARITANKCRIISAWLTDVYIGQSEKPWTVRPTTEVTLPQEVQDAIDQRVQEQVMQFVQVAGEMPDPDLIRTARMELEQQAKEEARANARRAAEEVNKMLQDQLEEGGFYQAITEFLEDLVTYPAAILKGPVLRLREKLEWVGSSPEVVDDVVYEFTRVDPRNIYPAPGAASTDDGYIVEVMRLAYEELHSMLDEDGVNEEGIRETLRKARQGKLTNWLDDSMPGDDDYDSELEKAPTELVGTMFDCLEYHGPVFGELLKEWELGEDIDPDAVYEIEAWVIDGVVIKVNLNPDPLGRRPYAKTCYENVPGEFWGRSLPDVLRDVQGVANASIRALVNNMSLSSGPQVVINIDSLAEGEEITNLTPWRIWQTSSASVIQTTQAPISFYQPNSNAAELMNVLNTMYQLADEFSLVPRYMAGQQPAGTVGRTASGLSMLLNAANKGLKRVVAEVDTYVVEPILERLFVYDLMYEDLAANVQDIQIVARGAIGVMQEDALQVRRNEFLQVTANPIDSQIVGLEGRAAILREVAKGLGMDVNDVIPDMELLKLKEQQMAASAAAEQPAVDQQMGGGTKAITQQNLENGAPVTNLYNQ